jgi:hypothetical protein
MAEATFDPNAVDEEGLPLASKVEHPVTVCKMMPLMQLPASQAAWGFISSALAASV